MEDQLLISKLCNVFQPNAEAIGMPGIPIRIALKGYKYKLGGLWVGGRLTVTKNNINFAPSSVNKALHENANSLSISMAEIKSVKRLFGFVSGIIVIETSEAIYKLRCFGAKTVAGEINEIINS
jgi:hypothetical protein